MEPIWKETFTFALEDADETKDYSEEAIEGEADRGQAHEEIKERQRNQEEEEEQQEEEEEKEEHRGGGELRRLAPPSLELKLEDYDMLSGNDLIGRVSIPLEGIRNGLPVRKWCVFKSANESKIA